MPGVSMAHGEVKIEPASPSHTKDVLANGAAAAKRKVRDSIMRPDYADTESSGDDLPLVSDPVELERNSMRGHDN
jgi:hypothetical protein